MGIIHTAKKNIVGELIKKKTQLKKEDIARMEGKIRELNSKELTEVCSFLCLYTEYSKLTQLF